MLGTSIPMQAVPYTGAVVARPSQPVPAQRVVESTAEVTLQRHSTASMYAAPPSSAQQLASSARQFADVLDTTGNVQIASSVSGLRIGFLDTYA